MIIIICTLIKTYKIKTVDDGDKIVSFGDVQLISHSPRLMYLTNRLGLPDFLILFLSKMRISTAPTAYKTN